MSVGVKDIALAAGVSLGTVSNVLNHPDRVSPRTKARVEQVMADLGFVPNESARQLRAGRSRTLAYVVLDASNPFFTDVARGVEETVAARDLSLFMCNSDDKADRERKYLSRLEEQRVAGILLTPVDPESPLLDQISGRGTPIVIVDRTRPGDTHCSVAVDDELGGRLAIEHLLDRGHERIAFIGGPATIGQVRDRHAGALAALADAGLDESHLVRVDTSALSVGEGRQAAQRLAGLPRSTAPHRGVLRQRPARPRPAPAVRDQRGLGARGPRDRRLRRHRVRRRGRRAADLRAPAPDPARPDRSRAAAGRGREPRPRPPADHLHARSWWPGSPPAGPDPHAWSAAVSACSAATSAAPSATPYRRKSSSVPSSQGCFGLCERPR